MDKILDLTGVPNEVLLILELTKEAPFSQEKQEALCIDLNWDLFLEYSLHHRLFPRLYSIIRKLDDQWVPSFVKQQLNHHYKSNTFRMLQLSAETEYTSRMLSEIGIDALFLKGPVVAHDLYGDLSLRTSSDLDFLVPIEQLDQAEELLVKQGYAKDDYIETVLNDWRWRHHHVTYFHPHKQVKLEIHWRLHPGPGKEPSFQELWERKRMSNLTNFPVYFLGREDLFIFLVTHGARHGWSRLRWLDDIQQLMKQPVDWKLAYQLSKSSHNLDVMEQAIVLASQLLESPITKEMKPFLRGTKAHILAQEAIFYLEKMVNLHTDPVPEEITSYHTRHLFSLMSTYQKFFFLLSMMYPYPIDVETLPLPKKLHFLYFPLRPLLMVWRKTRKLALS
ncbi:nucleotidyltransferase family protein [Peribacillus sp. FSL H8-0477]|uniref:nucleotidyltransferase domain-containing protein n=1 Tax=Peribacillus sp. FSL H8-0477 TaxID=2921388 RepID=UPI0030F5276A